MNEDGLETSPGRPENFVSPFFRTQEVGMNVVAEMFMPRGGKDIWGGKAKTTGALGKASFLKMATVIFIT